MDKRILKAMLTARDCICRICGEPYIGHGALCQKEQCRKAAGIVNAVPTSERPQAKPIRKEWEEII